MRFNKSSAKPRATMETHKRSASTSTTPVKKIRLSPVRLRPVIASLSPRVMEHMRVLHMRGIKSLSTSVTFPWLHVVWHYSY